MKIYFFVPSDRTKNPLEGFHQLPLPPPVVLDVPKTPSEIFELSQLTTMPSGIADRNIISTPDSPETTVTKVLETQPKRKELYWKRNYTSFRVGQKSEKPDLVINSLPREGEGARRSYQAQTFQRLSVSFLLWSVVRKTHPPDACQSGVV